MTRRALVAALPLTLAACGLGLTGLGTGEGADGGATDAAIRAGDASEPADGSTADAGGDAPVDAPPPPDPAKVSISYALGKNGIVYAFDALASTFQPLASGGCPAGEETAVLSDGTVYVTSSNNGDLYRLTSTGCTLVKGSSSFPYALGTAPAGTLGASEELVGYTGGDYVKVDKTTGIITTVKTGALGSLRPSGDVTAIGTRGFLAAQSGTGSGAFACPGGGDCIVEVSLATGEPVAFVQQLVGFGIYGIAHSKGKLLLYANGQVFPYDVTTKALGASMALWPGGASFSGAGAPPFPPP
jgi:hypothetical protein